VLETTCSSLGKKDLDSRLPPNHRFATVLGGLVRLECVRFSVKVKKCIEWMTDKGGDPNEYVDWYSKGTK
jgi:hypothetical protein